MKTNRCFAGLCVQLSNFLLLSFRGRSLCHFNSIRELYENVFNLNNIHFYQDAFVCYHLAVIVQMVANIITRSSKTFVLYESGLPIYFRIY